VGISGLLLAAVLGLRVRVLDPSGAAVPKAAVTLQCAHARSHRAVTGSNGEAAFPAADAAACTLLVEARGFEPRPEPVIEPDATGLFELRLTLARREEKVTVGEDTRESLARERSFSQVLTPEEIASLPDDPEEMENELKRRAGPGAVLRVNGFSGGRLPPKSQIRQIRIQTNRFAAEYHEGGHPGIEIVTKPGLGGWRTAVGGGLRDGAWASDPPLASAGGRRPHTSAFTLDGPLRKDKTSLALQLQARNATDVYAVTALSPARPPPCIPPSRSSSQGASSMRGARPDRARVQHNTFDRDGVDRAASSLPSRAADDRTEDLLRLSTRASRGGLGHGTRLQLRREEITWTPETRATAIDVPARSGGAT
jgi:hypothetical protein